MYDKDGNKYVKGHDESKISFYIFWQQNHFWFEQQNKKQKCNM